VGPSGQRLRGKNGSSSDRFGLGRPKREGDRQSSEKRIEEGEGCGPVKGNGPTGRIKGEREKWIFLNLISNVFSNGF
jgi:hypothetical protein